MCFRIWGWVRRFLRAAHGKPSEIVDKHLAENLEEKIAPHPIPSGPDTNCQSHMVFASAADSIGSFKRNPVFLQAGDG